MSSAVMRPSFLNPIFTRPRIPGRARPIKCSSSRVMRIMTGALAFFESSAGMHMKIDPGILLPKPPPVYSLIITTCDGGRLAERYLAVAGVLEVVVGPLPDGDLRRHDRRRAAAASRSSAAATAAF